MNYNNSVSNNQAFLQYYNITVNWICGVTPELKDPEHILVKYKFTKNSRTILLTLLKYMGVNHSTYVSQDLIARKSGVHHDTVHRTLKLFHKLGIINKKYRGANKTCIYSFGKFLHDPQVKYALRDIIPNLYWSIESYVRICKKFLGSLIFPIAASFKHDTARLSNDKNKDINKRIPKANQAKDSEVYVPTEQDISRYHKYQEREQRNKDSFQEEMRKLLGL